MTKSSLVDFIADKADLTKADATRALDAVMAGIEQGLQQAEKVTLVGFGTFSAKHKEARVGRNPQTGAPVQIPAKVAISFKAGNKLKDALN